MRRFLRYLFAAALAASASVSARAELDENGIEPYNWITFDNLTAGAVAAGTSAANHGSRTAGMTLPAGTAVAATGAGMAFQFGTTSSTPNFAPSSALRPTTYITRLNLNGGTYSDGRVWGANGQAYSGVGLCVNGSSGSYAVKLVKHAGGNVSSVLYTYSVPTDKETGFHWYVIAIDSNGTGCRLYVDGEEAFGTTSAQYTVSQNEMFGWGQLSNAGANAKVPTGLQVSDFRIYTRTLTAEQIKRISGGVEAVWGNVGSATEKGVATGTTGGGYTSFDVNFGAADNISQAGIEGFGTVCVSKIRLFRRSGNASAAPATITVSQSGAGSVTSTSVSLVENQRVYGAGWPTQSGNYWTTAAFEAVFDSKTTFDTSKPITLTFPSSQLFMLQPANSVMKTSNDWSPAIEITGTYTESADPRSFEATLDGKKKWSELEWTPELPKKLYSRDTLTINVTGSNPVLLMDEAFSTAAPLTFSGGGVTVGAHDDFYEDGCWVVDILKAGSITAAGGITLPAVKSGFVGAYSQSGTAITLRAQNREVISVNFANGRSQTGTDYAGLAPVQGNTWMNLTETWSNANTTKDLPTLMATVDGETTYERGGITGTWGCYTFYQYDTGVTDNFLKGYLDDGGNHARFTLSNIPYSSYDVIIYSATDTGGRKFDAITVNGMKYTCGEDGVAKSGDAAWGSTLAKSAQYGVNAMIVKGLNHSELSIVGGANDGTKGTRGGIAAIQIVCTGTIESVHDFTATISGSTNFGDIQWTEGTFEEGVLTTATITNDTSSAGEVAITFDNPAVVLKSLKIVSSRDVRLVAEQGLVNVAAIDVSECTGRVTYAMPVTALASGEADVVYAGGTAEGARVGIVHQGGALNLEGGTYNLSETHGDAETAVNVTDSGLNYSGTLALGRAAYAVGGNSEVNCVSFALVQGEGNDCTFTLKDEASVTVSGTTVADSNKNSVMFGHWDGDSVFTIRDEAAFTAAGTQILVGKTGGDQTINVSGGTVTAKGIKASASATGANALNLDGGSLVLGEVGISSYGSTTVAVNVKGDATITSTAKMSVTQPLTIDEGATLTLDATKGDITLTGKIANAGKIRVIGGSVYLVDADAPGEYETTGTGQVLFGYKVTINDCNRFTVPPGVDIDLVKLYDASGNEVTITSRDPETRVITFEMERYGKACLMEYLFPGNLASTGRDTGSLQFDGTHCFPGNEYVSAGAGTYAGIYAASAPWRNVTFPSEVTVVMYGKVMKTDNTCQIGIGSTTGGSKYTLFLASGDVSKDEVVLAWAYKNTGGAAGAGVEEHGVLCSMSVPNAQTADHLYAFTMQQVGSQTVVNIYLDGEVLQPYTFDSKVTLGNGIQLGSIHGGVGNLQEWPDAFGFKRSTEVETQATLAFLRVYDLKLGDELMRQMAIDYPYVSPNGSYQRTVTGEGELWDMANAWSKEGTVDKVNVPAANSTVKIEAAGKSELVVNLGTDATYESIQIAGEGPFAITRSPGTSGKVRSSGRVKVGTDTTFAYDAVDLLNTPLRVADGCTVTFDMSSEAESMRTWSELTYELTGLVTTGAEAKVVCVCDKVPEGRTISSYIDPVDQHFKVRVSLIGGLTADLAGDSTFDELVWKIGDTVVYPDWTTKVYGTVNVLKENAKLTFSGNLASDASILSFAGGKPVTLAAAAGVTVAGVTYDFTTLGAKGTFAFDPGPTTVKAGYVRYDLDMGTRQHEEVLVSAGGLYEFKKVRIDGNGYDYHDRTVVVQDGDYVLLHDDSYLGCGLSLDVRGGELHMGKTDGTTYVSYGRNGTRFNQSGGTVTVHAIGTAQTGNNGFVLAHTPTGGGCHEFNVTGGLFTVPESSICFNEATNTINVSKSGVVRARGLFSSKATSTGVINVTNGGTFEIGSLGATAGATEAFTIDGGTLRGYEDGAVFLDSIVFEGEAKVASAAGTVLTLGGAAGTGTGRAVVSAGTVRLGNDVVFGPCDVAVADGATLDCFGHVPANAISLAGSGADGSGAFVNNGTAVSGTFRFALAGNATVGGTGAIACADDSAIDLAGRVLAVRGGNLFSFKLGNFTVTGDGKVLVEKGPLALSGETSLGASDLAVGDEGTLDLSAGTSISCRNFSCGGTVTGSAATLVVSGTLDATAAVSVPKLLLVGGATLKGQGLVVTDLLTLGSQLNVTVDKLADNVKVAEVPADPAVVVSGTAVFVNGETGYALTQVGTTLLATKGGSVFADVQIGSAIGWTNFKELRVEGTVKDFSGVALGKTNINVVVTAEDGTVSTQRFDYVVGEGGSFTNYVGGLEQGRTYDVSVFVTVEGFSVDAKSGVTRAATARTVEGWIDESADTFAKKRPGTGYWDDPSKVASVADGTIRIASGSFDEVVAFAPTNSSAAVQSSSLKEVRLRAAFDSPSVYIGGEEPESPGGRDIGITVGAEIDYEESTACFMVVVGGKWTAVPRSTFVPEFGKEYELVIRMDERTGTVSYAVASDASEVLLATGGYTVTEEQMHIAFAGSGNVAKIDGLCYDANLMRVGDKEYWDLDAARAAAGSGRDIVPLWWTHYVPTDEGGAFRIRDNGYLDFTFAKWYHWLVERDDDVLCYRYRASNNWIEYADETGVVPTDGGWLVKNEVGLAWLAANATNKWLEGTVALDADLDLSSKNWTPIAQFTGAFDGQGHAIAGLNNTNVVDDIALGEAGYYFGGPTNDWRYEAYGLFASARNASFRNLTLSDVAISNTADSVAALLGVHAGGDIEVAHVTAASGFVRGEGRAVAGLLTVGCGDNAVGDIVVTGNVSRVTVGGLIDVDEGVGNVAQVLAGTSWESEFVGSVVATNNVGAGDFDVRVTDCGDTRSWSDSFYSWLELPVCNLAPVVMRYDENDNFRRFVEANANGPSEIPLDPVYGTVRMSAAEFANGERNFAGAWTDALTALGAGETMTVGGTGLPFDFWESLVIDRDVTIDLNKNFVAGIADFDVFVALDGVAATIKNGYVYYPAGYQATAGGGTITLEGVKVAEFPGDSFYQRTVPLQGLEVVEDKVTISLGQTNADFYYCIDGTASLDEPWELLLCEKGTGQVESRQVPAYPGGQGFYRVRVTPFEETLAP